MATSTRQLIYGLSPVILFLVAMGTASPGTSLATTQVASDAPKETGASKTSTQPSVTDSKKTDPKAKNSAQVGAQGNIKDGNKGDAPEATSPGISPNGKSLSQNQHPQQLAEDPALRFWGQRWNEFKSLIKALLSLPKDLAQWSLVLLVALWMFRKSIEQAFGEMTTAIAERGGTLDAGSLKFSIAEHAIEIFDERSMPISTLQFEIEPGIPGELQQELEGISPQYMFPVSDAVGEYWSKKDNGKPEQEIRTAYDALRTKCQSAVLTFSEVRDDLLAYCRTLEKARHLRAYEFATLLNTYPMLKEGCKGLELTDLAKNTDNFLIRQCVGFAFAQNEQWDDAKNLLADIVWHKDTDVPHYLPAAGVWLISEYHSLLETTWPNNPDPIADSPQFVTKVKPFYERGHRLLKDMSAAKWGPFVNLNSPLGYYKRALLKAIGSIGGILGTLSNGADRDEFLAFSEDAREICAAKLENDPPIPLDQNNLADLYRQRGNFEKAMETIQQAIADLRPDKDPMFYDTKTMIFWGQEEKAKKGMEANKRNYFEAILILEEYGEDSARGSRTGQADMLQYVDNKILAAKFAVASKATTSVHHWALAASKLEDACHFMNAPLISEKIRTARGASERRLRVYDMLGFAYMQHPGCESRALEMFRKAQSLSDATEAVGSKWQRRVNMAKVLTRVAQIQRRTFSSLVAEPERKCAEEELREIDAMLAQLSLERGKNLLERKTNCTIYLDTLITLQDLAEESFHENALNKTSEHLGKISPLLLYLKQHLVGDVGLREALGNDVTKKMEAQLSLLEQKMNFLLGRLSFSLDRTLNDTKLIAESERFLQSARGGDPTLHCGADLVLGELFLALALSGKGDVRSLYQQAITCLELAATHNVPSLRAETLRVLAEAYLKLPAVKKIARSKAASSITKM